MFSSHNLSLFFLLNYAAVVTKLLIMQLSNNAHVIFSPPPNIMVLDTCKFFDQNK